MRPYEGITLENFADWVEAGWSKQDQHTLSIMALGLAGEAGEVIEPIKKQIRGDGPLDREALKLEIGDVLHYLCRIGKYFDIDMGDVMRANIEKLETRRAARAK